MILSGTHVFGDVQACRCNPTPEKSPSIYMKRKLRRKDIICGKKIFCDTSGDPTLRQFAHTSAAFVSLKGWRNCLGINQLQTSLFFFNGTLHGAKRDYRC